MLYAISGKSRYSKPNNNGKLSKISSLHIILKKSRFIKKIRPDAYIRSTVLRLPHRYLHSTGHKSTILRYAFTASEKRIFYIPLLYMTLLYRTCTVSLAHDGSLRSTEYVQPEL